MSIALLALLLAVPVDTGAANRAFAANMYTELAKSPGNIIFSPASIQLALAMTAEGARSETETEMRTVLHLPKEFDRRALMDIRGGKDFELRVANKLWGQRGYPFLDAFLEITRKQYDAKLETVDFVAAAEPVRVRINDWVKEKTAGKITNLIPPRALDEYTRLVLTNAIYFKGKWVHEFDKKQTKTQPFFTSGEKSVQAPLMMQNEQLAYAAVDGAQLVSLPYKGKTLEMVLVVPNERDGLPTVEQKLSQLDKWLGDLGQHDVYVFLPRFHATLSMSVGEVLGKLGMPLAFSEGRADFSGISSTKDLFISAVIHKAFVDVNEEGTVAAAATAILMSTSDAAPAPAVVRADHPFLYFIRNVKTGQILFMGRVADPTQS
jgi:serpin B